MSTAAVTVRGYEVLELVGRGGQAAVYRARQVAFDRVVALKVLTGLDVDGSAQRRFERECKAAGALSWHLHIVAVHDAGTTEAGAPYLAMEFLEDGSFADRVARSGPLDAAEVASIGVQLCGALETAHRAGTMHRDVKPENVLIGPYGEAKLTDFGIATLKSGAHATATGVVTATVAHAAPEVLSGTKATETSDIYSLGSAMFALLTGKPAFVEPTDETLATALVRILTAPVPDLRTHRVPEGLARLVEWAMEKEPSHRSASAEEFGSALQEFERSSGQPVTDMRLKKSRSREPVATNETVIVSTPPEPASVGGRQGRAGPVELAGGPVEVPGYRDLSPIGSGDFSTVFRAYQDRLGRVVALKIFAVGDLDKRERERYLGECSTTGALTGHPNIVRVLDSGFTGVGQPYIAMDYYAGGSLGSRLLAAGPRPVEETLQIGVKIAGALETAHRSGVLHHDVKPQNILMRDTDEPALSDFGIATVHATKGASLTLEGGSPPHAPPEVLEGERPTAASDVYSLGSTLYTLLAGSPPFGGGKDEGVLSLLRRILENVVPDIPRADVPAVLTEVLRTAMSKTPADRFETAADLGRRLQEVQLELGHAVTEMLVRDPGTAPADALSDSRDAPAGFAGAAPSVDADPTASRGQASDPSSLTLDSPGPFPSIVPDDATLARETQDAKTRRLTRGRVALGALAVLIILGAGGVVLRPESPSTTSTTPPSVTPSTSPDDIDARAPTDVSVTEIDDTVRLSWTDTAGGLPYVVQQAPDDGQSLHTVEPGETSLVVSGLDPTLGYCFTVGVVVEIGEPSTVLWSDPACIRGAEPTG